MMPMCKVLLIDDEENARLGLSKLLSSAGHEVVTAGNGVEALDQLKAQTIDLIISDINMPEMDGLAFLAESHRLFPETGVIMLTAYGAVESYLEAIELGACEYLNKPVKFEQLQAVMERVLGDKPGPLIH